MLCRATSFFIALFFLAENAGFFPVTLAATSHLTATNLWWSFKPLSHSSPPLLEGVEHPIDRFILEKLRELNLRPSPEADRITLVRRLTFDLTGLPPSLQEVDEFLKDSAPGAFERVVDRLLGSPRYGERWARHWLDTVHFAETHGYDKDKPRWNAWPYRDYVIRAFNEDKPFSRFVQEQLAGDVLDPDDPSPVIATGFITAGPWDFVGHVELPITKKDGLIARYNDRDDMLMTTMSTFQSLTAHCARCHDHKFDPISQKEYYQLQAVFAGVDRAERPFDPDSATWKKRRQLLAEQRDFLDQSNRLALIRTQTTNPAIDRIKTEIKTLHHELANLREETATNASPGNGYHSAIAASEHEVKWVEVDLGQEYTLDEIRLIPARPTDFPDTPGFGFPKRFRIEIASNEKDQKHRLVNHTAADFANPGDQAVAFPAGRQSARLVRVTATDLWKRDQDYVFALAELQVYAGTNNVALKASVDAGDSIEAGRWNKTFLVDGFDSRRRLSASNDEAARTRKRKELEVTTLERRRMELVDAVLPEEHRQQEREVHQRLQSVTEKLAGLPKAQKIYAACSDFEVNGQFQPARVPRPVHLLARGDVQRPGELCLPGGLACIPGFSPVFQLEKPDDEGSRRAALARWITDPANPLTRRSIVNRIWHYHFGRGLVDTPNDFGRMGSLPTHPELLDWLAVWFLENGESLKKLHRVIVTSRTYRQASADNPANHKSDANNRYLWRMNRSRLDAEEIHDAILFASDRIDFTMGGPSVQEFSFKDDHSPVYDYATFSGAQNGRTRRSVYRFIVRSVPDPFMEVFDCPDASLLVPARSTTVTALQALSNLNDRLILREAEALAARLRREKPEPGNADSSSVAPARDRTPASENVLRARIALGFRLVLLRSPSPAETTKLADYTQRFGLENFCRVLFNTSEFLFLD